MKILFDHPSPFFLAHGGFQIQIEQTKQALKSLGVEVEWLRWWDDSQTPDLIHYFGRPPEGYVQFARRKKIAIVFSELLTGPGSRSPAARFAQKSVMTVAKRLLPGQFTGKLAWRSYELADAMVALTTWEKHLMVEMFDAEPAKIHVIPNGVEEVFFQDIKSGLRKTQDYLVCTATITERKRVVELAEAASVARTPLWIVGRPYAENDPYHRKFQNVVAASHGLIRFEGAIDDRQQMAEIYQQARGFVLLSGMESLSLSALEAAAGQCPLLLSDLPWARSTFGDSATYCPVTEDSRSAAAVIKKFYDSAPNLVVPPKPMTWREVAIQIRDLYQKVLSKVGPHFKGGAPMG